MCYKREKEREEDELRVRVPPILFYTLYFLE